jgi:hypothetical protein
MVMGVPAAHQSREKTESSLEQFTNESDNAYTASEKEQLTTRTQ